MHHAHSALIIENVALNCSTRRSEIALSRVYPLCSIGDGDEAVNIKKILFNQSSILRFYRSGAARC